MSKRPRERKRQIIHDRRKGSKRALTSVIALALCLSVGGGILAKWGTFRGATGTKAPLPAPTVPPPSNPSKEYVYAGSRLVATEEPAGGSITLSTPAGLIANAASSAQVNISWNASTGGTGIYYQVERSQSISSNYTSVSSNVTGTSFSDTTVTPGTAYLYRVRAFDSSGHTSAYSNLDYATAKVFQPIVANVTVINADEFNDLRDAVNAVRALDTNLQPFNWTSPAPSHNGLIKAPHIQQLRTNIDQALQSLSSQQVASASNFLWQSYTDPNITSTSATPVRRDHLKELRDRVKGHQAP